MMFRKIKYALVILLLCFPFYVFAYSDYIIASGENIGIRLNSSNILIIGTYEINGISPADEAGLIKGDKIISVNDISINTINEFENIISNNSNDTIKIGYIRDDKEMSTRIKLIDGKTGLYLKDSIAGIGTLTFIDPNTLIFGALGHEVTETNSNNILKIKDGFIFESQIIGIEPSQTNTPGEKRATLTVNNIYGNVFKNTNKGIFGKYTNNINETKLFKVAKPAEIKLGEASILTVLDNNQIEEYKINILRINNTPDKVKNIIFEITDEKLLSKTGGIIQGMSGSPIIQGEYIIGAVTHVVVNDPKKGYGIFIINMLEEAEKSE